MSRLKIGFDGRYIQDKFDGVGRYAFGLLDAMRCLDGPHEIVVFRDPTLPNSRFDLESIVDGARLRIEEVRVPLYRVDEVPWWWRAARRLGLHVFHSPFFWSPVVLPCPLVTTVHDMIFDRYPEYIPGLRYRLPYKVSSRAMMRRARALIAVSRSTACDVVQYGGKHLASRMTVIQHGVDARFRRVLDERSQGEVRKRYGLPDRFVLALGARRPHKNIPRLIAAFGRVTPDVPHALVLAGPVDHRFSQHASSDAARLNAAGRVLEIGRVDESDLPALYSMAELFVQPSIVEGFGLPLLEAMACGTATACSNTGSLLEVGGPAARLFSPHSEDSIANAIRDVLLSDRVRAELATRGVERAERYCWRDAAKSTLDVYMAAAGRGPLAEHAARAA